MKYLLLAITMLVAAPLASADARFCGVVVRKATVPHDIIRSSAVKADFKKQWPCLTCWPSTMWQIDHIIPLVCGGCDSVENMAWMPIAIKTCAGTVCKDRWEQQVYCTRPIVTIYR